MEKLYEIEGRLQKYLKPSRYAHTLGVCYTATALAMCHGSDVNKARLAGLLHDCAKSYKNEELIRYAVQHDLPISVWEKNSPHLLHAKVGAHMAQMKFGVEDEEILQAIRFHTTGKPDMSVLEKIIFIADYIEPNRKMLQGLTECRKCAFEDLDMAMYHILKNTLAYLNEKQDGGEIDETTQLAYTFYEKKKLEKGE